MKLIKQPTRYSCAAACVAMITGVPLEMIFADLGHDGSERYFRFVEYAACLNRYGFHLGAYSARGIAEGRALIEVAFPANRPALVIVSRHSCELNHAIFWSGKRVFDPAGFCKPLDEYRVMEWWPIIKIKESVQWGNATGSTASLH